MLAHVAVLRASLVLRDVVRNLALREHAIPKHRETVHGDVDIHRVIFGEQARVGLKPSLHRRQRRIEVAPLVLREPVANVSFAARMPWSIAVRRNSAVCWWATITPALIAAC
jgi:hypothetical protein